MKRLCQLCIFLLLAAALSSPLHTLHAQDIGTVSLSFEAGYESYYRAGQWVPLLVSVSNDGPALSGDLRVTITDSFGTTADRYAAEVDLPTQSSKQIALYVPLTELAQEIRVELTTPDLIVASATQRVRLVRGSDMLFAVITESPRGGIDLSSLRTGTGESRQANWRVENIPTLGAALRGLNALLITDANTGTLTPEQQQALEDWVLSGGHLVVTGGPNWQQTQAGLASLLPIAAEGTVTLTLLPTLAAFAGQLDHTLRAPAGTSVLVTQGRVLPGSQVLIEESGVPLLVRRALGGGYVDYLALDPSLEPFVSWDNRIPFWFTLLTTFGQRPSWAAGVVNDAQARIAADFVTGLRLPDVFQLMLFLTVYVVLVGPVNYLVLRRLGRPELAWISIPLIIVGVSLAYYLTGFNLRGTQAIVNRLTLVQAWPGGERARVDGVVGVLAPRRETYSLVTEPGVILRTLSGGVMGGLPGAPSVTIYEGTRHVARDVTVDAGTTVGFNTSGFVNIQPLEGEAVIRLAAGHDSWAAAALALTPSPTPAATATPTTRGAPVPPAGALAHIHGTIRNTTGLTLRDAVVLAMGTAIDLGTLAPDETREFMFELTTALSPPVALGTINWTSPLYLRTSRASLLVTDNTIRDVLGADYAPAQLFLGGRGWANSPQRQETWRRQMFLEAIARDQEPTGGRGTNVYVAGWTDESPLDVSLEGRTFAAEDTTLYIYRLPVRIRGEGETPFVEVPAAFTTWTPTDRSTRRDALPYDLRVQVGERLVFRFAPLPTVRLSEISAVRLTIVPGNAFSAARGGFSLWNWEAARWERIEMTSLVQQVTDEPGRFVGPENAVELQVEAVSGSGAIFFEQVNVTVSGRLEGASR